MALLHTYQPVAPAATVTPLDVPTGWSISTNNNPPSRVIAPSPLYTGQGAVKSQVRHPNTGNATRPPYRCEIHTNGTHVVPGFLHGQTYWLGINVFIPTNWQPDSLGEIFIQWHGREGGRGGPPLSLTTEGDRFKMVTRSNAIVPFDKANTIGKHIWINSSVFKPLLVKGKWISVVFHVKFSYAATGGFTRLYMALAGQTANHTLVAAVEDGQGGNMYRDDADNGLGNYLKFGVYKPAWNPDGSNNGAASNGVIVREYYHADLRLGDANSSLDEVKRLATTPVPDPGPEPQPNAAPPDTVFSSVFTAADSTAISALVPAVDVEEDGFTSSNFVVTGNAAQGTGLGAYFGFNPGQVDFQVSWTFVPGGADNRHQFMFRASSTGASVADTGYMVTVRTGLNEVQFQKLVGGVAELLVSQSFALGISQTLNCLVQAAGGTYGFWINGKFVLEFTDTSYLTQTHCRFRISTFTNDAARIDNLVVKSTLPPVATGGPFIKVQRVTGNIPVNQTSTAVAGFTAVASLPKAFARIVGGYSTAAGKSTGLTSGHPIQEFTSTVDFSAVNSLTLTRTVASTDKDNLAPIEVIESLVDGADGFTVLGRGSVSVAGTNAQTDVISGITDVSRCLPLLTGARYVGSGNGLRDFAATPSLTGDNRVRIDRANTGGTVVAGYSLVQFGSNWTVVTVTAVVTASGATQVINLPAAVTWNKTLIFAYYRNAAVDDRDNELVCWPGTTSTTVRVRQPAGTAGGTVRVYLLSHPNLTAQHNDSITGSLVELPSDAGGLQTVTRDLAGVVNLERTLITCMAGNRDTGQRNAATFWVAAPTDTDTITFTRARGGQASALTLSAGSFSDLEEVAPTDTWPPSMPGNLQISVGPTSIIADWNASFDAVGVTEYGYRLDGAPIVWTGSLDLFLPLGGFGEYTTHTLAIYARDAALNVSAPAEDTFTTHDVTPPTVPATNAAVAASAKTVRITSAGSTDVHSGVSHYQLKIGGSVLLDSDDEPVKIDGTDLSFGWILTGQTPGATLSLVLEAVDNYGNISSPSSSFPVTLLAAPGVPEITAEALDENTIQVSRNTPTGLIHDYQVYIDDALLSNFTVATFSIALFAPGQTVKVQVRSRNTIDDLQSALSTAVFVTTLDLTPPTIPGKPVAGLVTAFGVSLTSTGSTDATSGVAGYRWYRNGVFQAQTVDPAWTDPSPGEHVTNTYRVSAIDNEGNESIQSLATSVTTTDVTGPTKPVGSIHTEGSTWLKIASPGSTDTGTGVDYYLLSVNGILRDAVHQRITQFPYALTGLLPGSNYQLRIFPYDRAGNPGPQSELFEGRTHSRPATTGVLSPASGLVSRVYSPLYTKPGTLGRRKSNMRLALLTAHADGTMDVLPAIGTGTPTYSRASTALVRDYDNVYREIAVDMPRIQGARYDGSVAYWRLEDNTPLHPTRLVDGIRLFEHYRTRVNSTPYTVGTRVIPASGAGTAGGNGYWYECTVAGTSHTAPPTWPTTVDQTVTDGGVTWRCGGYYRIGGVLLERTVTNLALGSNLFGDATYWGTLTNKFSVEAATALLPGTTPQRHINLGVSSARDRFQNIGVLSGGSETFYAVVENAGSVTTEIAIYNATAATFVVRAQLAWATGAVTVTSGAGTAQVRKLADTGPNGGAVYLIGCTGTGTSGNSRRAVIYPTGLTTNTTAVIIHHAQFEVGSVPTSPIITAGSAVSRAADAAITLSKAGNFSDSSGILIADYQPADWTAPAGYILGDADGYVLKPMATIAGAQAHDGANTATGPTGTPSGTVRAALQWGNGLMVVAVHGSAGAETDYDGSFELGETLEIGEDFAGLLRNVRILE